MEKPKKFNIWMAQIRAPFLILAVLLVGIGIAFSFKYPTDYSEFRILNAILLVIGIVSAHASINLFNEYSDNFKTGIDSKTTQTPFSGGSKMISKGFTTPKQVKLVAISTLILSFCIGIYFSFVSHWIIMVFAIIGGLTIIFYTDFLSKILLGELLSGFTLGTLVVMGAYIAMTAVPETALSNLLPLEVVWVSIPPGILTLLLLFLNEFPDVEADKEGGRFHLVILLGRKNAAYLYTLGIIAVFGIIAMLAINNISSPWICLALLPLPIAVKACLTAIKHGKDIKKMIPALGGNVITVLATDLLLVVAIVIDII